MQNHNVSFVIDPNKLDEYFSDFSHKSPFNLYKSIKSIKKELNIKEDSKLFEYLVLELNSVYKDIRQKDYIYHNNKCYKIAIIKFRMQDDKNNRGKSSGWRVIALIDDVNSIFYLLDLYKHSKGKDNLTIIENRMLKEMCDEYANSIEY